MRLRAVALALCVASAAVAEPPNPYAEGTTSIGVDGASAPPSVQERVAWIRARLAEVLVYPKTAQRKGFEGTSRIQFVIGPDEEKKPTPNGGKAEMPPNSEYSRFVTL